MLARRSCIAALVGLAAACSSGSDRGGAADAAAVRDAGDDARIVPASLVVTALAGGNGVLELTALTLREGAGGLEVYAALSNQGDVHACSAALGLELFDADERSLAAGIGGLLTQRFHRLTDGSDTIAACVGPGDVTMAAITDLPAEISVEDVAHVVYRCPYFALDVVPIEGLDVRSVQRATGDAGTVYTGTLTNGLDAVVRNPSVSVFPVDRVGRPLGVAIASGVTDIPPDGQWAFETSSVDEPGVDQVAYPAGAIDER
jgi:hypothetical protein